MSLLELHFLGTGTSGCLPAISCLTDPANGCDCCISTTRPGPEGKKNVRRNTSAVLRVKPNGANTREEDIKWVDRRIRQEARPRAANAMNPLVHQDHPHRLRQVLPDERPRMVSTKGVPQDRRACERMCRCGPSDQGSILIQHSSDHHASA